MFGKFMGPSNLREGNSLAYREAWPACLKRGVYVACRCSADNLQFWTLARSCFRKLDGPRYSDYAAIGKVKIWRHGY